MIFLNNKYSKWYNSIIDKAQKRNWNKVDFYVEKHHIVPRCLGGTDDKNNLVTLTAREHFICHLLLTKITSGQEKYKMISAYSKMFSSGKDNQRYKPNSRFFEMSKKLSSEMMKENNPTRLKSVREKMILNNWSKKENSEEIRQKISKSKMGVKLNLTNEQRKKRSNNILGEKNVMYGKTHTDEVRQKLSNLRSKTWQLNNINTGDKIIFTNAMEYFKDNRKKYILFNNCKQKGILFDGVWEIESI